MKKRHVFALAFGPLLLWQSTGALVPSVVSILLQLLGLGGGGLTFIQLLALVAGSVLGEVLDLGLGLSSIILPPAILVFAL